MTLQGIDTKKGPIYSLLPLEDFKAILGMDDREDKIARYCLVTATYTIEQYCKRRLLRKKHFESLEYIGDLFIPLREYPVSKILAVHAVTSKSGVGEIVEPDFYSIVPECGTDEDIPFYISFTRALLRFQGLYIIKAIYWAGYAVNSHPCELTARSFCNAKTPAKARVTAASMPQVPPDLASACLELASWNMNRYRGRRIGMTGNIRGTGKDGEHFELSMPENVRSVLEPYRRKVI